MSKCHAVFDTEIIGAKWPVFLTCVSVLETGERFSYWGHSEEDRADMTHLFTTRPMTFVSFNGLDFDYPLVCAFMSGWSASEIKTLATEIIDNGYKHWQTMPKFSIPDVKFDHVDLQEVAPGVKVSLKRYMARMGYRTLIDMPFHHDTDLSSEHLPTVNEYCFNDCGGTAELFGKLREQIELREKLGELHGLDLRSKSDAQVAEAILRKALGITGRVNHRAPPFITYQPPSFIQSDNAAIQGLIRDLSIERFRVNQGNGSPEAPEWMDEDFKLGNGSYKVGIGGLHSTHDVKLHLVATPERLISDFDVASYYPNIIMKAGLIPKLGGNRGERFLEVYRGIYEQRIEAKHKGDKAIANTLKIVLNGTYGKLGSIYSAFYSPDLMLAVCLTGQLNLLILIDHLERIDGVVVHSANTDGLMVGYTPESRNAVLKVFADNSSLTGFEYEETPYRSVSMKDVNNYIAIGTDGKVKGKGLYADAGLQKNPTMQVCTKAVIQYLLDGTPVETFIRNHRDMRDFVAVREVDGGGIQFERTEWVDDWYEIADRQWVRPGWTKKPIQRKSRPKPIEVGVGGHPFGRVARWYMSTIDQPPISYLSSGNRVAKTEGGRLCLTLPDELPKDLDYYWYVSEANAILEAVGAK